MSDAAPPAASPVRHLILPGWLGSDDAHWQSRWIDLHGCERVVQDDWTWPRRGDWMARLDEVLLESGQPALLVAHSLGCHLVAAWAAHSRHTARVHGALLVAYPDTERDDMPPNIYNWRPMVRDRLPFASIAAISTDDPYCTPERADALARDWGSALVDLGARGHVNAQSELGDWPEGWALLQTLAQGSSTIGPW